jgi:hypothetical protein
MNEDEARERFLQGCKAAEGPIRIYIDKMAPAVRAANPFVLAEVTYDVTAPSGVVVPPSGSWVAIDMHAVYAADLETEIQSLPIQERLRERMLGYAKEHGAVPPLGRLPYVRIILYDAKGTRCAFGRAEDAWGKEAN